MGKPIVFGLVLGLCATSALAQPMTEQDKRKRHLPYVRNATDCIANSVGRNPLFVEAVGANRIGGLLPDAVSGCTQQLSAMVTMHDAIYGGGGMDFFKGPYLTDLERAVRSRLASRIASAKADAERLAEQHKAEAARVAAERAETEARENAARGERVATAEKVRDLIRERAMGCIGKQALPMLVTDEKAEVVAKAAMLFCEGEVNALVAATYEVISASGAGGNEQGIRLAAKKRVEEVVTAHIVRAKAELLLNSHINRDKDKPAPSTSPTL
jgi:hypothetical protein